MSIKLPEPPALQVLLREMPCNRQMLSSEAGAALPSPQLENTLMLWADPSIPPAVLLRLAQHQLVCNMMHSSLFSPTLSIILLLPGG